MKKRQPQTRNPIKNNNQYLYPYCIVWTMLPCISWLLPWIGHVGICSSDGVIHDFLGYHINIGKMAFGDPYKIVRLDINNENQYQNAIRKASQQFQQMGHNLCCNNCHHYVARVLQLYKYRGKTQWSQLSIWWMCLWESQYLKCFNALFVYLPFIAVCSIIALIIILTHIEH